MKRLLYRCWNQLTAMWFDHLIKIAQSKDLFYFSGCRSSPSR